jgi:UDP-glucose/GDP-mannose dehydrogenase family, NAD binding domain
LRNGHPIPSRYDRVAQIIATEGGEPKLIVEKSTVPAHTGQNLQRALAVYARKSDVKFRVASNPEFLSESTAVSDFSHPDRIAIGVDEPSHAKQLVEIYRPIHRALFYGSGEHVRVLLRVLSTVVEIWITNIKHAALGAVVQDGVTGPVAWIESTLQGDVEQSVGIELSHAADIEQAFGRAAD